MNPIHWIDSFVYYTSLLPKIMLIAFHEWRDKNPNCVLKIPLRKAATALNVSNDYFRDKILKMCYSDGIRRRVRVARRLRRQRKFVTVMDVRVCTHWAGRKHYRLITVYYHRHHYYRPDVRRTPAYNERQ